MPGYHRRFLFLQGPHGPFFGQLARRLTSLGHETARIGFNTGDRLFRKGFDTFERYTGNAADWPGWLETRLRRGGETDLVLYGTTRPLHAAALAVAEKLGLTSHVFEEGYLRPWWVTYERGGTNARSRLMDITVADMAAALGARGEAPSGAPARWGDTREHIFWGAVYHAAVLGGGLVTRPFPTHREPGIPAELAISLKHLAAMPLSALSRRRRLAALHRAAAPYHVFLLQLAHDANFASANPYPDTGTLIEDVTRAFAEGAPEHHHLVFKAHPLEDGRVPLRRAIARAARACGISSRVHFLSGAPLGPLLDAASSAVTVNSTAAHQALWRGLPLRVLGPAPHAKPEFTSPQPLPAFFAAPDAPDREAYFTFRRYLLATCQVEGGFYAARARRRLLKGVVDRILAAHDPYDALTHADAHPQQPAAVARLPR